MARFNGKIALVTGASSGIGRATALAFAREGAAVAVASRREAEGRETVAQIERAGGKGLFVQADVSREADVARLVETAVARFGRLDFAFNNAGVEGKGAPVADETEHNYEQVFGINVKGTLLSMKHELRAMQKGGGGAIVNVSSIVGHIAFPGASVYTASKHAVIGLTRALAVEVALKGITANAICPGPIRTGMTAPIPEEAKQKWARRNVPMKRYGEPEEIAHSVLSLVLPAASFITGTYLVVDGGLMALNTH